MNRGLFGEVLRMALETLRTNKMRSALTVLGVVIGITSIVGMTSLIRGFDSRSATSIRSSARTRFILSKLSIVSISGGAEFDDLMRRPALTVGDAEAIERLAPSVRVVDIMLGAGCRNRQRSGRSTAASARRATQILGVSTENSPTISFMKLQLGRFFTEPEVVAPPTSRRPGRRPVSGAVRPKGTRPDQQEESASARSNTRSSASWTKRPSLGGLDTGQDNLVVIP